LSDKLDLLPGRTTTTKRPGNNGDEEISWGILNCQLITRILRPSYKNSSTSAFGFKNNTTKDDSALFTSSIRLNCVKALWSVSVR